ncbi:MAG TPA: carboxypeptidase regulatory-like domain-containing protein [Thermoanaerobaculaceae bacterium]|nr:carboxypeptidase regulatory-like domain-containing protein [Thermoanaerobaculaceae bacterium]
MKRFAILTLLMGLAALPLFGQANPTGTLSGHVTDGTNSLPNVTVSVTSENLQGTRTATTTVTGDYILAFLPAGDYRVRFELAGFQTLDTTIKISAAQISRLDATMPEAKVAEEVTVTGTYETISSSAQSATTVTQDLLNKLPSARNPVAAAALTAGVTQGGVNNYLLISGGQQYENLYLVNGVAIQDNVRNTPNALYIEDAVQETTTQTSGISAEYGRFAGGVVNTLTKSGGNEFHASLRDNLSSDKWVTETPKTTSRNDKINSVYEATFGGYIFKDRLWFFLAGRSYKTSQDRQLYSTNIPYTYGDDQKRYEAKLTFAINPNHRLLASYLKVDETETNYVFTGVNNLDPSTIDPFRDTPQDLKAVNYTGVLSDAFFVEAQWSQRHFSFVGSGSPYSDLIKGTVVRDNAHGWASNSAYFCGTCPDKTRDNEDWFLKGSWFASSSSLGSHDVVFGYDSFDDMRREDNNQSGSNYVYWPTEYLSTSTGAIVLDPVLGQPVPIVYGDGSSDFTYWALLSPSIGSHFKTNSLFVNDRWRLNTHFSFNIGLRYDKNDGKDQSGATVAKDSRVSPRLGITYDPRGDGDWLFNAGYGQYVTAIAGTGNVADQSAGNPSQFGYLYLGEDLNTDCTPDDPGACLNEHEILDKVFTWLYANGQDAAGRPLGRDVDYGYVAGLSSLVAPGLKSPYAEEITVGATKRLGTRGLVRLDYVKRTFKDLYAYQADLSTGQVTDDLGVTSDIRYVINDPGKLERKYDGVSISASYQLLASLNLGFNYTWSHRYGNYVGESSGAGPYANSSGPYYYPEYSEQRWTNPKGDLPGDQRNLGRIYGVWDILNTKHNLLSVSLMWSYWSGTPYGASGNIYSYPYVTNPGYATRPTTVTYWFTSRDAYHTDNLNSTDLGLNYSFRFPGLGSNVELFIHPYVTNVFNNMGVDTPNQTVYTRYNGSSWLLFNPFTTTPKECPQGTAAATCKAAGDNWQKGPSFGQPLSATDYQNPRTYMVSFGVRF